MNTLCGLARTYGVLLGRIMIVAIFLKSAFDKINGFSATAAMMAKKGMPFAEVLLVGAIAFQALGGLMILFGWKARWGALLLILFTIPTTLIFHDFWNLEGQQYRGQLTHFMKNLAILGGLFVIMGLGSGPLSLDKAKEPARS